MFEIELDHDLDVMRPGQSLAEVTVAVLRGVERVLRRNRPDIVMVQGDTTSALAAALAAFYQRIPVGHVEAGLRTNDKYSPYPEEMNRRLVSSLADLLKRKNVTVAVEGNCDERGTKEYNLALGDKRAAAAKQYLISLGIPSSRVSTVSYGKEKPVCTESTEGCWAKNRRDHFIVPEAGQ